jgi:hypothetical protein
VPNEVLFQYLQGFKIVMKESNASEIHLRKHPRETGRWPHQLCNFLNDHGIKSILVDSHLHINEVMCKYLGMAGFASCALRDARAACDYTFVVCFEELSFIRYSNPRFIFGASEGIDWLYCDTDYSKNIFKIYKHKNSCNISLVDILYNLTKSA